ncbi:YIP1 family protein [Mycobacteroides salmoniphilum]|nr:YIP1 family protein [Mycobacteroides salmoniphilum]
MAADRLAGNTLTTVLNCRDLTVRGAVTDELPSRDVHAARGVAGDGGRRLAAFAAGIALAVAGVAGLHHLYRDGGGFGDWTLWSAMLLLWLSALGGGIKLAMWATKPAVEAGFQAAKQQASEAVQATAAALAMVAGALGMWWVLRGGSATWWHSISGEPGWSLMLAAGQLFVAVLAGAALFTGGKHLSGLAGQVLADAGMVGTKDTGTHHHSSQSHSESWHPALMAALIGGGAGLVVMTAWLTPKLAPAIMGTNELAAIAAIAGTLVWAIGSNLGWWKGLTGLYTWATDASQKAGAVAGVAAVLIFSASGLGLGWFTPATVPQAHAACPPDCGGGGGLDGPPGGGQMFQPPSQGGQQMPDYQGGMNQSPMDQNGSVSIYNTQAPSVSNNGSNGSSGQQGPQQGWDQPAHGTQIPDYQNATPYTQGPGKPNPDFNPGSQGGQANPDTNAGSQGSQPNQSVQQPEQAPQQPPQQDAGQQPNQSSDQQKIDDLTRQLQEKQQQSSQDRQRIDDMTKQLQQNKQNQKQQQSTKFPSKDKKKDDKDEQDDRDKHLNDNVKQDRDEQSGNNDLAALLLGAASTRRRKQGDQQGPDTQVLGQDASQAAQGLPGDIQTYVQSGQQIAQSSGQAAQGFGSAAQAGASLASSAQSGAVNPQDAITLVQGVSQGIQGTADAVNAGSQIVKTAQGEADQAAQAVGDANPQLRPQMEQLAKLNDQASQVTDGVGQMASGVSQVSGMANTFSGMGSGGLPDTSGASDLLSEGGTAIPMSGGSGLGGHLAQAPMEPPPTPTPPNYPEVPRTITPTPPTPSNSPEVPRTITPAPPSTSPSVPPSSSSPTPEPHLAPPVTAPGPVPEPPPATSAAPPPPSSTPAPESPSPQSTTPAPPATTTPAPPPVDVNKLRDLGYDDIQIANIQKIIQSGQGMSDQGINRNAVITALAVSLDESSYYNLPNDGSYYIPGSPIWNQWTKMAANNPNIANGGHDPIASGMTVDRLRESLNFPGAQTYPDGHVPSDHASLGLFQQQLDMWGTMPELLNPATSAQKFYSALLKVPGWQDMSNLGVLAQRVQGSFSADGSVYTRYITDATKIADALGVQ